MRGLCGQTGIRVPSLFHLTEAYEEFRRRDIHPTQILTRLRSEQRNRKGASHPDQKVHMIERALYQAILETSLEGKDHPTYRARHFLSRWKPKVTEVEAFRIQRYSKVIGQFTLPTIHAVVLRTWRCVDHGSKDENL